MRTDRRLSKNNQRGSTLLELMVATVVLLVGVVALAQLVPAAVSLNSRNRMDSSGLVYAQREMEQFVEQPLNVNGFTDASGFACTLGNGATFNTVLGSPVAVFGGRTVIDFTQGQVAGYSYYYTDPEDATGTNYDVRWAVVQTGRPGAVMSRRFLVAVRKTGGDAPITPATLDSMVSK